MIRNAILLACVLSASCDKGAKDTGSDRSKDNHEAFDRCLSSLEAADVSDPLLAASLARGCSAACPGGLVEFADAIQASHLDEEAIWRALRSCDIACSKPAASRASETSPATRLQALADHCGLAYFQLPENHDTTLTPTSAVAGRIHHWLRSQSPRIDATRRERLDRATARVHVPLSPPASLVGGYELPDSRASQLLSSAFYIVLDRGHVRAAARPVVRLRGTTLELRPVPGGPPPGHPLEGDDHGLGQLRELEDSWKAMHSGSTEKSRYVYLADGSQSTERLLAIASRLGHRRFRLGVSGLAAREHKVELVASSEAGSAAPRLRLAGGDLVFAAGDGRGTVAEQLKRALVSRAPLTSVELTFEAGISVAELVSALDVIASAGGSEAVLSVLPP